jgi:hypothetical protein
MGGCYGGSSCVVVLCRGYMPHTALPSHNDNIYIYVIRIAAMLIFCFASPLQLRRIPERPQVVSHCRSNTLGTILPLQALEGPLWSPHFRKRSAGRHVVDACALRFGYKLRAGN